MLCDLRPTTAMAENTVLLEIPPMTYIDTHLLPLDLPGREVVTLYRVAPALAVASVREGQSLCLGQQWGQGHRSRLSAKTDRALQGNQKQKKERKDGVKSYICSSRHAYEQKFGDWYDLLRWTGCV